jgi:cytochrome P450 PksS
VLALLEQPDQIALLRKDPERIGPAVEEFLRFASPVQFGAVRGALADVVVGGIHVRSGTPVIAMLASANRDDSVFRNPDQLDITRSPNRHLAFGLGTHFCLGAQLARFEARIAIRTLFQRYPNLRLAVPRETLRWRPAESLRGLEALPVDLR